MNLSLFGLWLSERGPALLEWLKANDELASWAQAVGGFAAIVGAFMIARSDRWASRAAYDARQTAIENFVMQSARTAILQLRAHTVTLRNIEQMSARAEIDSKLPRFPLEDAIDDLRSLPIQELDDPLIGLMIKRLRHQFRHVENLTPEVEIIAKGGEFPQKVLDIITSVDDIVDSIMVNIEGFVDLARSQRAAASKPKWMFWGARIKTAIIGSLGKRPVADVS